MDRPTAYRIRVRGQLGPQWSAWFEGLEVADESDGESTLTGLLLDQAALHGVLARVRDLGLELVSVEALEPDDATRTKTEV
jgi:hypothetical protein